MDYSFKNIFDGIDEGFISIWAKSGGAQFFFVEDWAAAENYMFELGTRTNAYFNPSVLKHRPSGGRRGTADDVSYVTLFNLDWDIKVSESGVHAKNEQLPETLDDILACVAKAGLPSPTAIINSGNGYYGRFHLRTPFSIGTETDRSRAKAVSTGLQRAYINVFATAGWHMDATGDLVRVTRNPGTFNYKTDPAKPVTLVDYVEDRAYTIEELEAFAKPEPQRQRNARGRSPFMRREATSAEEANRADFNAVAEGCDWVRNCLDSAHC